MMCAFFGMGWCVLDSELKWWLIQLHTIQRMIIQLHTIQMKNSKIQKGKNKKKNLVNICPKDIY